MSRLDLVSEFSVPDSVSATNVSTTVEKDVPTSEYLFQGINWKLSTVADASPESTTCLEPFPDLKVNVVQEIISTGGLISAHDVTFHAGKHLSPAEFHQCILDNPDAVLIDVRNTFEHDIGHFVHPTTQQPAINPKTVIFSSFDATFAASHADSLKGKKVLMYCTGGIRCEKASVMLKQRGVTDVAQLSGGIHRYLETYGAAGFFRGKNFVFDQRVAQTPSECLLQSRRQCSLDSSNIGNKTNKTTTGTNKETGLRTKRQEHLQSKDDSIPKDVVVGKCIECKAAFDELFGSRICTVCRDLVLVCSGCQSTLREYHCNRLEKFKTCYYTFLEVFTVDELLHQKHELQRLLRLPEYLPAIHHRNVRRTVSRQMEKIAERIQALETGNVIYEERSGPRRCRTCRESRTVCDGRCWGFWKTTQSDTNSLFERGCTEKAGCLPTC